MRNIPPFQVRGRSVLSAGMYLFVTVLFLGVIMVLFGMLLEGNGDENLLFCIAVVVPLTLVLVYVSYTSLLYKTVIIDGVYFVMYSGPRMKISIPMKNIKRIRFYTTSPWTWYNFKFISIKYVEKGRTRTFQISEDLFPYMDLVLIFREIARYTRHYRIKIIDPKRMGIVALE